LRFCLNSGFALHSLCLLFSDLLLLTSNLELSLLLLDLKVILYEFFGNGRLSDAYCNDFDAWGPFIRVYLQDFYQVLVELVKLFDVDFVKGVFGAELVYLMVDLIVDPGLIVVNRIVLDGLPD